MVCVQRQREIDSLLLQLGQSSSGGATSSDIMSRVRDVTTVTALESPTVSTAEDTDDVTRYRGDDQQNNG